MKNLKHNSLLLVGNQELKGYFENYFKEVLVVKDNREAFINYEKKYYPVIFLYNDFDIIKKIREHDRETILVLITKKVIKEKLLEAIPLHLSGCIEMPFKEEKIQNLLKNINKELELLNPHIYWLKDGYSFDAQSQNFYDNQHHKIKLTKNERIFLQILLEAKKQFVSIETLEHSVWEETSLEQDCRGRFKALLNAIRKKLPKESIINSYGMGYMLVTTD